MGVSDSCRNEIQAVKHGFKVTISFHGKKIIKKIRTPKLQVIRKRSLKFWLHKSGNVGPQCIICRLVGEACILRFDMPHFIRSLKTARWGEKGRPFEGQICNAPNDNSHAAFRWRSVKARLQVQTSFFFFFYQLQASYGGQQISSLPVPCSCHFTPNCHLQVSCVACIMSD